MDQELALELYELCKAEKPDMKRAEELIQSGRIDLNASAVPHACISFLTTAIDHFNYSIAELLLENGADPNAEAEEYGSALWTATRFHAYYLKEEPKADPIRHLRMARLLLEKGADPNGSKGTAEAVLDYVVFRMFNDLGLDKVDYDYAVKSVILMAAYGAATEYCKPEILKPLDKERIDQYSFHWGRHEDGHHCFGVVENAEGEIVAYI
ncbi:MAG: hypothetical protein IJ041_05560 [Clostridia bacterium]|nr:hypothetical protein [Clostridia bacterium]